MKKRCLFFISGFGLLVASLYAQDSLLVTQKTDTTFLTIPTDSSTIKLTPHDTISKNLSQEVTTIHDSLEQTYAIDSGKMEVDSTTFSNSKRLLTPSLLLDYGKLLTFPFKFETKYEGGIELLFIEHFPVVVEAGTAKLNPRSALENGKYESNGWYYRVGLGYLGSQDQEHNIGISFRYGVASFDESFRPFADTSSGSQSNLDQPIDRKNLNADWWEVVLYTDRKLFKNSDLLWLGFLVRFRMLRNYDKQEDVDVYAIPGYGRSFDKTIPTGNFFVKIQF